MSAPLLEPGVDDADALLSKLLLDSGGNPDMLEQLMKGGGDPSSAAPYTTVIPKPGMCLKIKGKDQEKYFVNICHAENVPEPKDLTDQELIELLESEDPTGFRIPMSIGEPHAEIDKVGKGCTAYDVVIHPNFLEKIKKSDLFRTFFITVMCEGIENKYNVEFTRDWIVLKNRKFLGSLPEHNIRTKSKPLIMDMGGQESPSEAPAGSKKPLVQEVDPKAEERRREEERRKAPEPKFSIEQVPPEGHPEFLVAEIHLPKVKTASTLILDIGEDRLRLETRSNAYFLDIFLPFNLVQEECGAQFNRASQILSLTLPVQPEGAV